MPTYSDYTDDALLKAIRESDEQAFSVLFQRYWRRAHHFTYSKIRCKVTTEELVQDFFMNLWDKRATLVINNFNSYLHTSLKHKALNFLESCIVKRKYWDYYQVFIPRAEETTGTQVEYNALIEAIEKGMEMLPKKSKTVFQLSRMEGRSIPEIAGLLNVSEKVIEYHLTRSLKYIRLHLKDYILLLAVLHVFCS